MVKIFLYSPNPWFLKFFVYLGVGLSHNPQIIGISIYWRNLAAFCFLLFGSSFLEHSYFSPCFSYTILVKLHYLVLEPNRLLVCKYTTKVSV